MDMTDIITKGNGGRNLAMLARQFGLSEAETRAAVDQLVPAVEAGLRRETTSPDGLSGLLGALAGGNHARYLDGNQEQIVEDGNGILGHIFGSKDVSRGVAARAAETSGVSPGILKQMLPIIAAMVMGALSKRMGGAGSGAGGIGDILGNILGGGAAGMPQGGGGLGDILGQVLAGGTEGGRAASPGGGGGLGDILGQVLGGAGGTTSAPGGGIGDILGSLFGQDASPEVREEATRRANGTLGNMLGGGTRRASDADELLASVDRAVGRR